MVTFNRMSFHQSISQLLISRIPEPLDKAIILREQKLKFNWPFLFCQGSTILHTSKFYISENLYSVDCVSLCSKSEAMLAAMQPQLKSLKNVKSLFYSIIFHGSMTA